MWFQFLSLFKIISSFLIPFQGFICERQTKICMRIMWLETHNLKKICQGSFSFTFKKFTKLLFKILKTYITLTQPINKKHLALSCRYDGSIFESSMALVNGSIAFSKSSKFAKEIPK